MITLLLPCELSCFSSAPNSETRRTRERKEHCETNKQNEAKENKKIEA